MMCGLSPKISWGWGALAPFCSDTGARRPSPNLQTVLRLHWESEISGLGPALELTFCGCERERVSLHAVLSALGLKVTIAAA
jgi:hypothetical protein